MPQPETSDFDELFLAKVRLAITGLLLGSGEADFVWLRQATGASDGNLSVHLRKLEEAGYISVRKSFAGRKPVSHYSLTATGKAAFERHVAQLESLCRGTTHDSRSES